MRTCPKPSAIAALRRTIAELTVAGIPDGGDVRHGHGHDRGGDCQPVRAGPAPAGVVRPPWKAHAGPQRPSARPKYHYNEHWIRASY